MNGLFNGEDLFSGLAALKTKNESFTYLSEILILVILGKVSLPCLQRRILLLWTPSLPADLGDVNTVQLPGEPGESSLIMATRKNLLHSELIDLSTLPPHNDNTWRSTRPSP
jgi:hypothetical protein